GDLRRDGQQPPHARSHPEAPLDQGSRAEGGDAREHEEEGDHDRIIRARVWPGSAKDRPGNRRARRNLPDTWALMRSPPLVSLGPSGLAHTRGRRAHGGHWHMSTRFERTSPLVHVGSTFGRSAQPTARPVAGSIRVTPPPEAVSTRRPHTRLAAVTTSVWAMREATVPSASIANVSSSACTRTCRRRDEANTARTGVPEGWIHAGAPVGASSP